jgi:hypothetical protein
MLVNPPRTAGRVPTNEELVAAETARIRSEAAPLGVVAAVAPAPAIVAAPVPTDLAGVQAARKAAAARKRAAEVARSAAAEDPAVQLAEEQLALARERREAELEEHELEADRIYREACLRWGEDRVARIHTARGSIVMRPPAEIENDISGDQVVAHDRAREMAKSKEEAKIHERNANEAARAAIKALVLTSHEHLERVTRDHFLVWNTLALAKNALVDGKLRDLGKVGAH